jgi:hypothetical protein
MAYRILFRRDTSTNWESNNPVLGSGEPGYETDTNKLKVGDGSTAWSSLPILNSAGITGPTGDVDWGNINSSLIADNDSTYDIGSLATKWNNIYIAGSLYLGDSSVSIEGSGSNFILTGGTGNQIVGDLTVTGDTNIRPYKVYSALVSQTSTNDPTGTVLHSTFDSTLTWTRSYSGRYTLTSTGEFTSGKVFVIFSQNAALGTSSNPCHYNWQRNDSSTIYVESLNSAGATADGLLYNTSVEVRVYN